MPKENFVQILFETGLRVPPKKKTAEEEKKEKDARDKQKAG